MTYRPHLDRRQREAAQAAGRALVAMAHVSTRGVIDRGNRADYLVRRLKRDAPEIAAALGRGERRP